MVSVEIVPHAYPPMMTVRINDGDEMVTMFVTDSLSKIGREHAEHAAWVLASRGGGGLDDQCVEAVNLKIQEAIED